MLTDNVDVDDVEALLAHQRGEWEKRRIALHEILRRWLADPEAETLRIIAS